MNMREKIAMAIFDVWAKSVKSESTWEDVRLMNGRNGYGEAKRIYKLALDEADAVLDVLMEPTEGMYRAAFEELVPVMDAKAAWEAMIQAAREGE